MGDSFVQSPANFDTGSVSRHAGGTFPAANTMGPHQPLNIADSLPSIGDSTGGGGFFGDIGGSLTKAGDFIGGLFEDFELPDAKTMRAITGLASGVQKLVGGFQAANLQEYNAESSRLEARLSQQAAAMERFRDLRMFRKRELKNEAIQGGSGLLGYEDIFADDKSTFAYEQLMKEFNNKVFVFGKLRDADKAAYLAEQERFQGIQKAGADIIDTFFDLNPVSEEKTKKKEKLGEA